MDNAPIRVLLVEDNPGDIRLIREMLAEADHARFDLTCVDRLSAAIERLVGGGVDVVLLDLSLPDGGGMETLGRLHTQVPVVVLTGLDDEALGMQLVQAGAQDYMVKGQVTSSLLARALRYAVERNRAEQQTKTILRSSIDGFWVLDTQGNILEVNDAYCRLIGYSRDELLSMKASDVEAVESPEEVAQHIQRVMQSGGDRFETRHRCKDSRIVDLEGSVSFVDIEGGRLVAFLRDITDRKRAEQALHRRAEELAVLHTVAIAGVQAPSEDALIERVTQVIGDKLFSDNFGVLLLDEDAGALRLHHSYRIEESAKPALIPLGQGVTGQVAADGKPRRIGDVAREFGYLKVAPRIQSELCVPLKVGERIIGVINAESEQRDAFTDADEQLMIILAGQLATAIERLRAQAQVQRLATIDELTHVFNRLHFFELAQREFSRARRYQEPLSAIMLDIDHFKQVNDKYRHATGDQVLQAVAARCQKGIRVVDILGRYGGDEFAILLPNTDLPMACRAAERLRERIAEKEVPTRHGALFITISLGVAQAREDTPDPALLLDRADTALYGAKRAGRNLVMASRE